MPDDSSCKKKPQPPQKGKALHPAPSVCAANEEEKTKTKPSGRENGKESREEHREVLGRFLCFFLGKGKLPGVVLVFLGNYGMGSCIWS